MAWKLLDAYPAQMEAARSGGNLPPAEITLGYAASQGEVQARMTAALSPVAQDASNILVEFEEFCIHTQPGAQMIQKRGTYDSTIIPQQYGGLLAVAASPGRVVRVGMVCRHRIGFFVLGRLELTSLY